MAQPSLPAALFQGVQCPPWELFSCCWGARHCFSRSFHSSRWHSASACAISFSESWWRGSTVVKMSKREAKQQQRNPSHRSDHSHSAPRSDSRKHALPEKAAPPVHDLDRLIHERMRLGILSALAVNESLTFNDLKG